ncbi:hypothetical protein [Novosphingobium sp.]|uniref:hypothetical protein n=1 Tax=Novosphingobium sp. TaxID=1874826 RepID=UPI00286E0BA4|nr:hypothetical protein [Novosphingobium sp.]
MSPNRYSALVAGLALASPALAADTAPIELWNGFTTASTKAEIKAFKAAKPKRKVEVYPGCIAEMGYRHSGDRLVSIIFLGQDREANCFARMFADLRGKYGVPQTEGTTFGSVIGYGSQGAALDTTSAGTLFIWREVEKKTKIVKSPGNGYNLIFTVRPDKYIY